MFLEQTWNCIQDMEPYKNHAFVLINYLSYIDIKYFVFKMCVYKVMFK